MSDVKLLPCPFCGNEGIKVECEEVNSGTFHVYVLCGKCNARGPTAVSEHHARLVWNAT